MNINTDTPIYRVFAAVEHARDLLSHTARLVTSLPLDKQRDLAVLTKNVFDPYDLTPDTPNLRDVLIKAYNTIEEMMISRSSIEAMWYIANRVTHLAREIETKTEDNDGRLGEVLFALKQLCDVFHYHLGLDPRPEDERIRYIETQPHLFEEDEEF